MSATLTTWPITALLVAVSLVSALTFAGAASADDGSSLDLGSLVITDDQAASGGMEFRRSSHDAFDPRAVIAPGPRVDLQRASEVVRQGWDTFFLSTDGRTELHIRIIEFVNNHWATRVRARAIEPTPSGFPPDTRILTNDEGTFVAASVIKRRIQVIVYVQRPGPDQPAIDRPTADAVLRHVLSEQLSRLPETPDLDSSTRFDVSDLQILIIGLQIVAIPTIALWLIISATLRDSGTLERFFPGRRRARAVTFYDLAPAARKVRRRALRRTGFQLVVATAVGVVVLLLQIPVPNVLVELALLPVALAVAIVVDVFMSSRRSDGSSFEKQSRFPIICGTIGAMVVLYAVAFLVFGAISFLALFDSGSWVVKLLLVAIPLVLGLRALKYAALPMRFAKRLVARDVAETLATDPRQEIVMLRSFQDDGLMMRMHRSARHNPIELASAQPFERFEELIAWSLWRFGPVVAIGQPTTEGHLRPLGAAREFYSDDDWQDGVRERMRTSSIIVFVVGRSPGLWWEVTAARRLGFLEKCLFVFPPVDYVELADRLCVLSAALGLEQGTLPTVDSKGRRLVGLYFDDTGQPIAVGVDGRDDLSYQTLFESVAPKLITRKKHSHVVGADAAEEPGQDVASLMDRFDPFKSYSKEPSVWSGLSYVVSMLMRRQITWLDADSRVSQ